MNSLPIEIDKHSPLYKYQTNLFEDMISLSVKAREVSKQIEQVQTTILDFQKSIQDTFFKLPENELTTSLASLLLKNMNAQIAISTNFQLLAN